MFKHYLASLIRRIKRQKLNSIINILVFAIGLASIIMLIAYAYNERNYDLFHSKAVQIVRVSVSTDIAGMDWKQVYISSILAPTMKQEFPEIINRYNALNASGAGPRFSTDGKCLFYYTDKDICWVSTEVLEKLILN